MANTIGTTKGDLIAQQALTTLLARIPLLTQITTSFGASTANFNQRVVTHTVTAGSASSFNVATGYVPANRTQTDVPVTIDKHYYHAFAVNDQEASESTINLIERFAPTAAHALGKQIADDLFALVTAANYANSTTSAAGAFDRPKVVDISKAMNDRNVMLDGRFMILAPGHYANLFKDTSIVSTDFGASGDAQSGMISSPVHGFAVSEYSALPGNGENLVGIAGVRESLCLVTRIPELPQERSGGRLSVVTEPNTGLSVLVRQFYNWRIGQEEYAFTLMYGVAKANTGTLQRIVSA